MVSESSKELPKVSVVVPCYNGAATLKRCLQSIILQDHRPLEIIFIDNQSADGSARIAKEMLSSADISYSILSEPKKGVSHVRNLGTKHASGDFICFLDVDDTMLDGSVSTRVSYLMREDAEVTFASYDRISGNLTKRITVPESVTYRDLLRQNYIPNLTAMYNVHKIGKHYQNEIGHEDYDMWLRIFYKVKRANACDTQNALAEYNDNISGISSNKLKAAYWHWNILKRHVQNPLERLAFFAQYVISGVIRRL